MSPLLIALQFLTRIPVPNPKYSSELNIGKSILYYPLVGLLIGLVLVALNWLFLHLNINMDTGVRAALILSCWVLITGALHLDGLADSADAWLGGFGNKEKTLHIMQDPRSGPAAIVIVVLLLLIKFTAVKALLDTTLWPVFLIIIPILARTQILLLFLTTPCARSDGLGSQLTENIPRQAALVILGLIVFAMTAIDILFKSALLVTIIITTLVVFWLLRRLTLKRINGTTGDTAGASIEIIEAWILVVVITY